MFTTNLSVPANTYLLQLQRERLDLVCRLSSDPVRFAQLHRLLLAEIRRVSVLLNTDKPVELLLPEPSGPVVHMTEKLVVPTDIYPEYNFIGRIVGPQGESIRRIETMTGCKISLVGRGTKKNPDGLENLYVIISTEDALNRAELKVERATNHFRKIFKPDDSNDPEKLQQLLKLARLNKGQHHPAYNKCLHQPHYK